MPITKTATAQDLCTQARSIWLEASSIEDLDEVEQLYRQALNSKQQSNTASKNNNALPPLKKKKKTRALAELSAAEYRKAGERLSLLYCQSGRAQKAKKGLEYLGFICRLSQQVLDYPLPFKHGKSRKRTVKKQSHSKSTPPCVIYDNVLYDEELDRLKEVFGDPKATY